MPTHSYILQVKALAEELRIFDINMSGIKKVSIFLWNLPDISLDPVNRAAVIDEERLPAVEAQVFGRKRFLI